MEQRFEIELIPDDQGMIGRECPNVNCKGYFKIEPGTGPQVEGMTCHCPYCSFEASHSNFITENQKAYGYSIIKKDLYKGYTDQLHKMARNSDRKSRGGFLQLSIDVKVSPRPIQYYAELELETDLICDHCGLHYAIYGMFGYCPDCTTHNSFQILSKNLELALKIIENAHQSKEEELGEFLLSNALNYSVASFDGFGRETCRIANPPADIRFQNIVGARKNVSQTFGFDIVANIAPDEWEHVVIYFNKRHLLAHNMGVIDEEYIRKTNDTSAIIGRKVVIDPDEIRVFIGNLEKIANTLVSSLPV